MDGSIPKYALDGKDHRIQLSEKLAAELRPKLLKENVIPYRNGKLDFVPVLKLWKFIQEKTFDSISKIPEGIIIN
jgi:hypothetical protein